MCTLIVSTRAWQDAPLVVAANRDEDLDRPAEPPALRTFDGVRLMAPRDVKAGGTWLGLNEHGVFVGITNRFGLTPVPTLRSRGQLVLSILASPSAKEAFARAQQLDAKQENGFHLIMADVNGAYLVYNNGEALTAKTLSPGWHVVTERSFGAAHTGREPLIHGVLKEWADHPPNDETLLSLLSVEHPNGFDGVLVSVPAHNYGTRSSTIVRLHSDARGTFRHAHGRPDQAPLVDHPLPPDFGDSVRANNPT